jgi:hypothetical protein
MGPVTTYIRIPPQVKSSPFCVTIDFESLEDKQVTIRERDSLAQIRVPVGELGKNLAAKLKGEAFDASLLWTTREK